MAEHKNQHYIPQHYLSRWAIISNPNKKNEHLPFILDKSTNNIKQKNIKNLFSESYFYDIKKLTEPETKQLRDYFHKKIPIVNSRKEVKDSYIKKL